MDENDRKPILITEVNVAEDIPNGDDSAFGSGENKQNHVLLGKEDEDADGEEDEDDDVEDVVDNSSGAIIEPLHEHNQVFVATSQGLLSAATLQSVPDTNGEINTTHIVIHDQTLAVGDPSETDLKSPTTPLPPPTPATPLSKERGFRYQWDTSAFEDILPVRCKNTSGEMHKMRFGSGILLYIIDNNYLFINLVLVNCCK